CGVSGWTGTTTKLMPDGRTPVRIHATRWRCPPRSMMSSPTRRSATTLVVISTSVTSRSRWSGGDRQIVVRFGSVTHHAVVFAGDTEITRFKGGYMPFEADLTAHATPRGTVRLTVVVDNRLDYT